MAKIILNNKEYNIDDAVLASISNELKNHFANVINGSGATIKFGGMTYGVDSGKLSAVTTDLVAHLGAIAGSGAKVTIGGVEYGVDAGKVSGALAGLESAFGELGNGGSEGLNEYGFYYNKPYRTVYMIDGVNVPLGYVLNSNGTVEVYLLVPGQQQGYPMSLELEGLPYPYIVEDGKIRVDAGHQVMTYEIAEDGRKLVDIATGEAATLDDTLTYHDIYFGRTYYSYTSMLPDAIFHADGSVTSASEEDVQFNMPAGSLVYESHKIPGSAQDWYISMDGQDIWTMADGSESFGGMTGTVKIFSLIPKQ